MRSDPKDEATGAGVPSVTDGHRDLRPPADTRAWLRTADGVRIEAAYTARRGSGGAVSGAPAPVLVVAHGFTGSLERPALRRAVGVFAQDTAVVTFSFRGHGDSSGRSTVGDREVLDLAAVVRWARTLGHREVATVGFSMGGSVVIRHAALYGPHHREAGPEGASADARARAHPDAAVSVSAPARWFYRGTAPMRRLHWAIERPAGRLLSRYGLRTRVHPRRWDPVPLAPVAAVPLIAPVPLLIVHGDRDPYFPLDHPRSLAAAGDPHSTELWLESGFGHAENAAPAELLRRIAHWATAALSPPTG